MRAKLKTSRKILTSILVVLFIISIIPVLAQEEVDITVNVVFTYIEEVPADTPTTIDVSEEAGVVLEDFTTDEPATVTIIVSEENPHPEVEVPPESPMALGIFLEFEATVAEFTTEIRVYYTDDEVEAAGIDEEKLCLYYFDDDDMSWVKCEDTGVNTEENYIWAQVTHFTLFSPFGALPNQPPVADAGGPYYGRPGRTIDFDGTWSYDPDGEIVSYAWNFGDGTTGEGSTLSHKYDSKGTYTVTLTVTDDDGLTDSASTTVTVSRPPSPGPSPTPNKKPKADAGPDMKISVGSTIHFSGADSYDEDGEIVSHRWNFGDGTTATGVEINHTYTEPGHYNVTLTVKDNRGVEDSDKCAVFVWKPPVPVADRFGDLVPGEQRGFKVNALDEANTIVTLNTTKLVTVTVLGYEDNPYPDDPIPAIAVPIYVDVEVSDPDAVDWPIYVEMFYIDEEVEGLDEDSLGIYYWFNGTWQRCSDTGVDTENNIVWAYMTAEEASGSPILMGGIHAIIVPVPPLPPILDNLTITLDEVERGDNVTISLDIENIDSQSFTYIVTIQIGELTLLVDVELEPYESKTVSQTITPDAVGEYNVTVDGLTGNFMVKAPPKPAEFVVSGLEVDPDRVAAGEAVTITVEVENIGEKEGTHTVLLEVDGLVTELAEVTLDGGESTTVTFTTTEDAGDHTVGVEDLTGDFTVTAPGISPGYVAGIIIVIIAAAAILYANWKGLIPKFTQSLNSNLDDEKIENRRNKN